MNDSLVVKCIDSEVGLEDKETLIKALRAEASNGGDGRCLCAGCLAAWALRHFVDSSDAKWEMADGLPRIIID